MTAEIWTNVLLGIIILMQIVTAGGINRMLELALWNNQLPRNWRRPR